MSRNPRFEVVQFGLSGLTAATFRETIAHSHSGIGLEAVVAMEHDEAIGKTLGRTKFGNAAVFDDVPVISYEQALNLTNSPIAFSGMRRNLAEILELEIADTGRNVVTVTEANRSHKDALLVNSYVNYDDIDEYLRRRGLLNIIASDGGMASLISPVLAPIQNEVGIVNIDKIETLQGRKSADSTARAHIGPDSIVSTNKDDAEQIEYEVRTILGTIGGRDAPPTKAKAAYGSWDFGNQATIEMDLAAPVSKSQIQGLLRNFRTPKALSQHHLGSDSPKLRPVRVKIKPIHKSDDKAIITPTVGLRPTKIFARVEDISGVNSDGVKIEIFGDNMMTVRNSVMNMAEVIRYLNAQ